MTYDLPIRLEALGLARRIGDWLEVDAYVAGSYMMCLATVMSNEIQAPLITDTPGYRGLGEYLAFGQPMEEFHTGSNVLLKLNIDFPNPKSLRNVSIETILDFHHKHSDERKRFRQAIESINIAASQINDSIALNDFFSQQRKEIKSAIEDHQKTLNELKVKLIGSLLSVSTPTVIAAAAGLAIPPVAIGLTGTGIAVSLVKWWAEIRGGQRETVKKSPWHYLLSVQQFTPKTSLGTRLWALRQKAIAAGEPLLTAKELEQELAERRGGYGES